MYLENINESKLGIYCNAKIPRLGKSESFKVTYFDSKVIVLMWKDKDRIINYTLSLL